MLVNIQICHFLRWNDFLGFHAYWLGHTAEACRCKTVCAFRCKTVCAFRCKTVCACRCKTVCAFTKQKHSLLCEGFFARSHSPVQSFYPAFTQRSGRSSATCAPKHNASARQTFRLLFVVEPLLFYWDWLLYHWSFTHPPWKLCKSVTLHLITDVFGS